MNMPETAEELLALTEEDQRGAEATFWALTDEDDIVACERFRLWKGEGHVFARVFAEGFATRYRVVCESIPLDYTAEWDDRIGIPAEPNDAIKFHFTLQTAMLGPPL